MKLKDIADMNDYLENRCYCPYEYLVQGVLFMEFLWSLNLNSLGILKVKNKLFT